MRLPPIALVEFDELVANLLRESNHPGCVASSFWKTHKRQQSIMTRAIAGMAMRIQSNGCNSDPTFSREDQSSAHGSHLVSMCRFYAAYGTLPALGRRLVEHTPTPHDGPGLSQFASNRLCQ